MKKVKTIVSLLLIMFLMVPFVNANADTRLNKVKKSLGYSSDDNLQGHTEKDLLTKNSKPIGVRFTVAKDDVNFGNKF